MAFSNPGFDPKNIEELKNELKKSGKIFKIIPDEENSEEYVNFYFVGKFEGKEVIYDAVLYTFLTQVKGHPPLKYLKVHMYLLLKE